MERKSIWVLWNQIMFLSDELKLVMSNLPDQANRI